MILAGDLGGTKTNLALFPEEGGFEPVAEGRLSSPDYPGLEQLVEHFLASPEVSLHSEAIRAAVFGIAGPVRGNVAEVMNLPWVISRSVLADAFGIEKVKLINDLEATGYGVALLTDDQTLLLNEGTEEPDGHGAIIAAGTGLGEAVLYRHQGEFLPIASEGGHCTFAPRNELEIELLRYLLTKWEHVSFERVVSGQGLFNIYCFFRDTRRADEPAWLREEIENGDAAAVIAEAALSEKSHLCVQVMDLFVSLYGSEAGNLALKCKALGGMYVGGGIAPKLIGRLQKGDFMKAFAAKGRLTSLLENIPVRVILNPKTALLGAARCGRLMLAT